jgi:hypothetical protein
MLMTAGHLLSWGVTVSSGKGGIMSLVSSMLKVPKPEASPASWTSAGRIAAAATLILGAAASVCSQPSSKYPLTYARTLTP